MSEVINHWLKSPELDEKLGCVVMLGCNSAALVRGMLARGVERLVVLEPDPDAFSWLKVVAEEDPRVELRSTALGPEVGTADFYLRSLPMFSSLRPLGPSSEYFPGLYEQKQLTVQATTLDALLRSLHLSASRNNVLRMCLPAASIVASSDFDGDLSEVFSDIFLKVANVPAFQGDQSGEEIVSLLEERGFRQWGRSDTDPEFPELWLRADRESVSVGLLQAEVQNIKEMLAGLEARNAELVSERDAAVGKLERLAANQDSERKKVEALSKQLDDVKKRHKAALADAKGQTASERKKVEALSKQLDDVKKRHGEESADAQSQVAVAIRMQALRDADLRDLQIRYSKVVEERDSQAALLNALTTRLTEAEDYLNQIDRESSESPASSPERLTLDESSKGEARLERDRSSGKQVKKGSAETNRGSSSE